MNLEYLKDYPYTTKEAIDDEGKPYIIYKCGFEGCDKQFSRTWGKSTSCIRDFSLL